MIRIADQHSNPFPIRICFLVLALFTFIASTAQRIERYPANQFSKKIGSQDGLSNSNVTCIYQDTMGFMWFGTNDGLNRYDGYSIKIYRDNPADSTDLNDNRILKIFSDRSGTMWALAWSSLHYYDLRLDRFVRVPIPPYYFVTDIIQSEDSAFMMIGRMKGIPTIVHYNFKTGKSKIFSLKEKVGLLSAIKQHTATTFWLGGDAIGFQLWDMETNTYTDLHIRNEFWSIAKIKTDEQGNLWLATDVGLVKFDPRTRTFNYYTSAKDDPFSIPEKHVLDIAIDHAYVWVGTANGGLCKLDLATNRFTTYAHDPNNPESINDNSVWSIYKDQQSRIWIGTFSKGVNVMDNWVHKFHSLRIPFANTIVNALHEDHQQRLWIGTEAGMIRREANGSFRTFSDDRGKRMTNPVLTIFKDLSNRIWMGTWNGGACVYDEPGAVFRRFVPSGNMASAVVYGIGQSKKNRTMVLGSYHGVNLMENENKPFYKNVYDPIFDGNLFVRSIYEDSRNRMWVGTIQGLNVLDMDRQQFIRCFPHQLKDSSSVQNHCNFITEDREGNVIVGTNKGLLVIKKDSSTQYYTTKDGLPSNQVEGIVEDTKGKLWLSTTQGLSCFSPDTQSFRNFVIEDGLNSLDFKPGSCAKSESGWFYFGGSEGVNFFHPDSIKFNPFKPSIYFTELRIFNKAITPGDSTGILDMNILVTKEIRIPPGSTFFSITFAALNFSSSSRNQYAYKLEGFDPQWVDLKNQRSASFTNLDPGHYTLKVKASNNDGLWNEEGISLTIIIEPHWYQTVFFKVLFSLIALSFIGGIALVQIQRARNRNKDLSKTIEERTSELKHANEELLTTNHKLNEVNISLEDQRQLTEEAMMAREHFLSTMSHEIRTPLNSLIGLSQLLKKRSPRPDQEEILNVLHNSGDHLLRLVNDILDFSKIRASKVELETIEFSLEELLKQIYLVFEINAKQKLIQLTINRDLALPAYLIGDPTRLEQILYNLVSNAIKFTSEGQVKLDVKLEKKTATQVWIEFNVSDTGIGIAADKIDLIFKPFNQTGKDISRIYGGTGLGLTIVKGLVELMKGRLTFKSEFMKGSEFQVCMPFDYVEKTPAALSASSSKGSTYPAALKGLKILYAEDVESNQFLMKNLMEDMQIDCDMAMDGESAVALCKTNTYDLILMDIEMPGIDGYEAARQIKTDALGMNKATPIVGFSAAPTMAKESPDPQEERYIIDFISKPFKTESLVSKILKYCT